MYIDFCAFVVQRLPFRIELDGSVRKENHSDFFVYIWIMAVGNNMARNEGEFAIS